MKKYLFLIFLFLIYLILSFSNKTQEVISYNDENNSSVSNIIVSFKDGINSNKLIDLFKDYKDEYYVKEIIGEKNNYYVSCISIEKCISQISEENKYGDISYFISGFKVKNIKLLTYKDRFILFANKKSIYYEID